MQKKWRITIWKGDQNLVCITIFSNLFNEECLKKNVMEKNVNFIQYTYPLYGTVSRNAP